MRAFFKECHHELKEGGLFMKLTSGVIVLISALVLFVASAYAQQGGAGMQQEGQGQMQQESASMMQNQQVVSQLQQALNSQGYKAGPADGKWGSKTEQALRKFQQAQGMEATGQPDQQTLAALGLSPSGEAAGGQQGDMGKQQSEMSDQQSGAGGQMSGEQQSGGGNQ